MVIYEVLYFIILHNIMEKEWNIIILFAER